MKEFIDEKLIKARNEYKMRSYGNVYNGIYICEKKIEFQKQNMFDDKISIYIPNNFVDMPDNYAKLKYPMSNRPQVIKMNDKTDVNFTFNIIPQKVKKEQFDGFVNQMINVLKTLQSKNVFYEKIFINKEREDNELSEIEDKCGDRLDMCYFDYKSPAIDGPIYNFMLFALLENEIFHGTFNCRYDEIEQWKFVFLNVMDSIRTGSNK